MFYSGWTSYLTNDIEVIPIELAGRGKRFTDPLYNDLDELLVDVYALVMKTLRNTEHAGYALFGHSMGSLVVYELYHRLINKGYKKPTHLFFSGWHPPCLNYDNGSLHLLSNQKLKEEIFKIGGTPMQIFENKEVFDHYLPMFRSDFKIIETYNTNPKLERLDCDITIINGSDDNRVSKDELESWREFAGREVCFYFLKGDHFYLHHNVERICEIIRDRVLRSLESINHMSSHGTTN